MGWIAPVVGLATTAIGALSKGGQNSNQANGSGGNPLLDDSQSGVRRALTDQYGISQNLQPQVPQAVNNQQALAQMLMQQSQGQGPNPAQAALNQATGQNIAAQSALMASHRGAGANQGLIARQAAMQGGNLQQQAAGQSAIMQAQQQLAAQQALANLSNQQIGQTQAAINADTSGSLTNQGQFFQAQQAADKINADAAQNNANGMGKLIGGLAGGAGSALTSVFGGSGGGGGVTSGGIINSGGNRTGGAAQFADGGSVMQGGPRSMFSSMPMMNEGGQVDAMLSPGEGYIPPSKVKAVASGKLPPAQAMERVPGTPAQKGNHLSNDVVPAKLEKGGFVIPNSIMQSDSPEKKAQEFVAAYFMKRKGK